MDDLNMVDDARETDGGEPDPAVGAAPRTLVDKLLTAGVALAVLAVVVALGLIGWSVFGPKPGPRTEAERLLERGQAAVASDPASSTAHIDLGAAYFEAGQYSDAEKEFKTAQGLMKGSPVPLYNLAHVYRLQGRTQLAAETFAEVLAAQPNAVKYKAPARMFLDARYWLGAEYVQMKRWQQAVDTLLPLTKNQPLDAEAAKMLASAYEALGKRDEAIKWLQAVLVVQPGDAEAKATLKRLGQ